MQYSFIQKIESFMDSMIIISMLRQYFNLSSNIGRSLRLPFSTTPFFQKSTPPPQSAQQTAPRKFSKLGDNQHEASSQAPNPFNFPKQNVEDLVNKINDTNKYFLGIKYNTNYLKTHKTLKYEEAQQMKADKATITDLPLELAKTENANLSTMFETCDQNAALAQKAGQIALARSRLPPTLLKIQQLYKNYVLKLSKKERLIGLQPNFQLQCIKILNALGPRLVFQLKNEDALPDIKIKNITILKGLCVIRNDNYSTDSFEKNESELADGIVDYKLYRQPKEQYPQIEWLSTKRINARFEVLVRGGPIVEVLDSGATIGSSEHVVHSLVVETDLVPPPPICLHQMTPEQYLRSYRLDYNSMTITNVDRKNEYYALTYTEKEKTSSIINRIE